MEKSLKQEAPLTSPDEASQFFSRRSGRTPSAVRKFPPQKRGAGILMHVSSLHSDFGIGDFGPGAYNFVSFLRDCKQRYWQVLPLTAVDENWFSPYSATSSVAGNIWLISPEQLADEKLLSADELKQYKLRNTGTVDFAKVIKFKSILLEKAFERYPKIDSEFHEFTEREAWWLDDYAIYEALRKENDSKPWYEWPSHYKYRDSTYLSAFSEKHRLDILKVKWCQFIFFRQWRRLKQFANSSGIQIVGDVPFYMNYDSADVWAHPEQFKLDTELRPEGVAGVPPDYFNSDGQLWGMPVYRWDVKEKQRYSWWVSRLRSNMEMFDIVRLDHFRAFEDFWEVPAGESTAARGEWKPGPGKRFFEVLEEEFQEMPFVAEDLGDISKGVTILRDRFSFPGMKVLQFAFGDGMPTSEHIPHNYSDNFFAYTGTHDNNTTKGWYQKETDQRQRNQIEKYIGCNVGSKNVHRMFLKLAFSSVARTVIVPMQDVLGLGSEARMNKPASTVGNWSWRVRKNQIKQEHSRQLIELTEFYGRF